MKLKLISLKGYQGIEPSNGLVIDELSSLNIFIGPNNSGKSTIFRFLHFLKLHIESNGFDLYKTLEDVDYSWWWNHDTSNDIQANIVIGEIPEHVLRNSDSAQRLVSDAFLRLKVLIKHINNNKTLLVITPLVRHDEEWHEVIKVEESSKIAHLSKNGIYIFSRGTDNCPYHEPSVNLIKSWAKDLRFFDPIRAIDRSAGSRRMDDGAELLVKLFDFQHDERRAAEYAQYLKKLLTAINELIQPTGIRKLSHLDIKGTREKPRLFFNQNSPIALENMGTGISELAILLSSIIADADSTDKQYFIEEPEVHLHPGLLRRLINLLTKYTSIQFFVSSHSNTVIDALNDNFCIFHFSQQEDGACTVLPCKKIIEHHRLLDSLGVSGSTLLQSNSTIWVEGPSDRLYIRYWLKAVDPSIQEGSDYSFAFYGGKILSHFAFDVDTTSMEDFLSLLKISRFSAIVMDKDLSPNQNEDEMRDAKKRILREAQVDSVHRLAITTRGREIENDVPTKILLRACANLLGLNKEIDDTFSLQQNKSYSEEILNIFGVSEHDEKRKSFKDKLSIKTSLAITVMKTYDFFKDQEVLPIPDYINLLADFIRQSRLRNA